MKYLTHQITPTHLFSGFEGPYSKKKCAQIFKDFLLILFEDIIENNTTFKIPHRIPAYLSLEKIGGEQLKKERQGGRHKELDLIKSKFTAANIVLSHYNQKWLSDRWSIPKEWREKINENIYNGKY